MEPVRYTFVTGANGYIGSRLCTRLAGEGFAVKALVRKPQQQTIPGVEWVLGQLNDQNRLVQLMEGCAEVYHLAAMAVPWAPDSASFYEVNVQGAINVTEAAFKAGVRRVVVVSTAGVMGPTPDGRLVSEETNLEPVLTTHYERSKLEAERRIRQLVLEKGLDVVIVNPSRVYGPAQPGENNPMFRMIQGYTTGRWRWIPGDGTSIGNYVYIDDVIDGLLLAMQHGRAGERYILGGENADFNRFFELLSHLTGKKLKMWHLPLPLMFAVAHSQQFMADVFGKTPLITPDFVKKYLKDWPLRCDKAKRELGYTPCNLETGLKKTLGI